MSFVFPCEKKCINELSLFMNAELLLIWFAKQSLLIRQKCIFYSILHRSDIGNKHFCRRKDSVLFGLPSTTQHFEAYSDSKNHFALRAFIIAFTRNNKDCRRKIHFLKRGTVYCPPLPSIRINVKKKKTQHLHAYIV